jgi:hypothetical protein
MSPLNNHSSPVLYLGTAHLGDVTFVAQISKARFSSPAYLMNAISPLQISDPSTRPERVLLTALSKAAPLAHAASSIVSSNGAG